MPHQLSWACLSMYIAHAVPFVWCALTMVVRVSQNLLVQYVLGTDSTYRHTKKEAYYAVHLAAGCALQVR